MSLEGVYNHIVKEIERRVKIKHVFEWDGGIPFTVRVPEEFTEHDYYEYAMWLTMKYTRDYSEGKIPYYQWKKHLMAIFIMLNSFLKVDS